MMIKISTLSEEETQRLYTNVEGFFPMYKKNNRFKLVHKELLQSYGKIYNKEIWTFITCITKALRYGNCKSYMSFNSKAYARASKLTKHPINCTKMVKLSGLLENDGYLTKYVGYKNTNQSSLSVIEFHDKFITLFDTKVCESFGTERDFDIVEMYETSYVINSEGKEVKTKEFIPLKSKQGYGKIKRELFDLNTLVDNTEICVNGEVRRDVVYKRVYERSFLGAGRYYTLGRFQTLTKIERQTITLKGNQTYSEDVNAIHPNIIRTWLGIEKPITHDPYTISFSKPCDQKELRELCKVGLMCLLYNRTKGKAIQALTRKLTKDKRKKKGSVVWWKSFHSYKQVAKEVLDKLIELNSDISKVFFREDLWYRLQGADATMAEYVINHFVSKGHPILPWHDSYRVEVQHKEELKRVMREAWINVLGNDIHFSTSEE